MKIPTPSFFKIRLAALVIAFLVMCFVVGVVRDVWAGDTWETSNERWLSLSLQFTSGSEKRTGHVSAVRNFEAGTVVGTGTLTETTYWKYSYPRRYWCTDAGTVMTSNRISEPYVILKTATFNAFIAENEYRTCQEPCPGGVKRDDITGECMSPCQEEAGQLTTECGGPEGIAWEWTNEELCLGQCLPCSSGNIQPGQETPDEAAQRCIALDKFVAYYDADTCRGVCDNCSEEDYLAVKSKCGKLKFTFSEVLCEGDCNYNCDMDWAEQQAKSQCPSGTEPIGYTCEATPENGYVVPPSSVTCKAPSTTKYPVPQSSGDEPPDDSTPPNNTNPADDPTDPNDPNQWNSAMKENQDRQIQQNDQINNQLGRQNDLLNWIGENQRRTVDNTKALGEILQNGLKAEIGGETQATLEGIEDELEAVDAELEEINSGEFVGPEAEEPYLVEEEYDFGTRTSEFIAEIRSTSLFSLPNRLSSSIPGGGSSTLTISSGETFGGDHTIDFSGFSSSLNMLKYLFQIAGMIIAIRIVTLKR